MRANDRPRMPQRAATNTANLCFRCSSTLPRLPVQMQPGVKITRQPALSTLFQTLDRQIVVRVSAAQISWRIPGECRTLFADSFL